MSTPTDTRRDLVTVIAHMRAKPGKQQELREALEGLIDTTSKEAGYVNYDLHQGIEDPALLYLYENWESVDTHEAQCKPRTCSTSRASWTTSSMAV